MTAWGANGRRTATLGWPGTGLRYTTTTTGGDGPRPASPRAPSAIGGLILVVVLILVGIVIGRAMG